MAFSKNSGLARTARIITRMHASWLQLPSGGGWQFSVESRRVQSAGSLLRGSQGTLDAGADGHILCSLEWTSVTGANARRYVEE